MYLHSVLQSITSEKRPLSAEDLYKLNEAVFNLPEEDVVVVKPGCGPAPVEESDPQSGAASGAKPSKVPPKPVPAPMVQGRRAWREGLKAGDYLDAKDADGNWYESRVMDTDASQRTLLVRYLAWSTRYDEVKHLEDDANNMAPPFTKLRNWRRGIKAGDQVEVPTFLRLFTCRCLRCPAVPRCVASQTRKQRKAGPAVRSGMRPL